MFRLPLRRNTRDVRAAVTLIELMVVTAILAFVVYAIFQLLSTMISLSSHSEAWSNILQWSQQGVNRVSEEAASLRRIYPNDALGNGYLAVLPAPSVFPRLGNVRLPTVAPTGNFRADTLGNEQTGNCFLLCRERPPFDAVLAGGATRRIDVYTLVIYYLSPVNRAMGPWPRSLILARWESVEFADWTQVTSLAAIEQPEVMQLLSNQRAITHLWRFDQAPATAFFPFDAIGNLGPVDPLYAPVEARNTNVIQNLGFGFAGVAWNRNANVWISEPTPLFGLFNPAGDGFPHGFEVQVTGPTGARTILFRLVISEFVGLDQDLDTFSLSAIVNAHEF